MLIALVLFATSFCRIETLTNNINCWSLNQADCLQVLGCYWNSTDPSIAPEYTQGGRCVKNPCLDVLDLAYSCPTFTGVTCSSSEYGLLSKGEHTCTKSDPENPPLGRLDCIGATVETGCTNGTKQVTSGSDSDRLCYVQYDLPPINCQLSALLNGGVCRSGNMSLFGQQRTLSCREIEVGAEGVKTCVPRTSCERYGVGNCVYYPECMIVDGQCVNDECASANYDSSTGQCDKPETCIGYRLKKVWYNYTYEIDSGAYIYKKLERKYYYDWFCTNKIYNSNPNPYYGLQQRGGTDIVNPSSSSTTNILNYPKPGAAGGDRCATSRDACGFCPKLQIDATECTDAGGVIANVDGAYICTDGRGPYEEPSGGASMFRAPSMILLIAFFVVLQNLLN